MKKFFLVMTTPFWSVQYEPTAVLQVQFSQDVQMLRRDCQKFEGQMELDESFKARLEIVSPDKASAYSLRIDTDSLQHFSSEQFEYQNGVLYLKTRKAVCDFLENRNGAGAEAQASVGPAAEQLLQINQQLEKIEKATEEPSKKLAAAKLGFRSTANDLQLAFPLLLHPETFERSSWWQRFGEVWQVQFPKSAPAGIIKVKLELIDPELQKVESQIKKFETYTYSAMSAEQHGFYKSLNRKRSDLLKNKILNRIKKYARL